MGSQVTGGFRIITDRWNLLIQTTCIAGTQLILRDSTTLLPSRVPDLVLDHLSSANGAVWVVETKKIHLSYKFQTLLHLIMVSFKKGIPIQKKTPLHLIGRMLYPWKINHMNHLIWGLFRGSFFWHVVSNGLNGLCAKTHCLSHKGCTNCRLLVPTTTGRKIVSSFDLNKTSRFLMATFKNGNIQ